MACGINHLLLALEWGPHHTLGGGTWAKAVVKWGSRGGEWEGKREET
uniref:Uncharacterized protein n=1 Tax=Physcomitrium patens TaxID=3218 RepID=A0A2K1IZ50_PHYPA|nr:hypothetical protein PHYPA_024365 [Physcomitrium patens]